MSEERRRTLRYPFHAPAEVSDEKTGSQLSVHLEEISLHGCYLQTQAPFPAGSMLLVKVFAEGSFFESRASVLYAQPAVGMGVAFHDLKPYYVAVLKKWLLSAMLAKHKPEN
jgi:hypothetical protein